MRNVKMYDSLEDTNDHVIDTSGNEHDVKSNEMK